MGGGLVAAVVARNGAPLDPEELRAFCRSRLAGFKVPKAIEPVGALPRTASGKLRRGACDEIRSIRVPRRARKRWGASARAGRHADAMRHDTMPVTAWMVDAIAPQPGQTILELAAGPGDAGFLAAELIIPGGTLITTDVAPEMLTAAQERAQELGIHNVRFLQVDAESIDLPAASVDGVLCRWGYMLLADPEAGLRETRRVLRPAVASRSPPGRRRRRTCGCRRRCAS